MARRYEDPPRSRSLRNDGDKYLTSEERARLIEPPLVLSDPAQLGQFLGYLREDNKRIVGEYLPDIDGDLKALSRDVTNLMLFNGSMARGIEGGPADQGAAIALAIATAVKNSTPTPTSATPTPSSVYDRDPIVFSGESTTFVASTEQFIGSDGVAAATAILAGCIPNKARTLTRVKLSASNTFIAAAATLKVNVYGTNDGVNFTLLGSATFTGDGATRLFDSNTLTVPPVFSPTADVGGKAPGYTLGIVSSAGLTTRLGVELT